MQYKKELVPGIVLTVIAVLYLFFTTQIQPFTGLGATPLTNRFMPFFWGTCLLILSIMLIIRGVRMRKKELAAGKVATSGGFAAFWDNYKEVVLSFNLYTSTLYDAKLSPLNNQLKLLLIEASTTLLFGYTLTG